MWSLIQKGSDFQIIHSFLGLELVRGLVSSTSRLWNCVPPFQQPTSDLNRSFFLHCLVPGWIQTFIRRKKFGAIRMRLCLSPPLQASATPQPWQPLIPAWSLGVEHPLIGMVVGGRKENQGVFEPSLPDGLLHPLLPFGILATEPRPKQQGRTSCALVRTFFETSRSQPSTFLSSACTLALVGPGVAWLQAMHAMSSGLQTGFLLAQRPLRLKEYT